MLTTSTARDSIAATGVGLGIVKNCSTVGVPAQRAAQAVRQITEEAGDDRLPADLGGRMHGRRIFTPSMKLRWWPDDGSTWKSPG